MVRKFLMVLVMGMVLFGADAKVQKSQSKRFELTSVDGKKYHIVVSDRGVECEECKGKVLLLDFFGKHCPPCRASIPTLAKVYKKLGAKFQILAFHVQEKLTPSDIVELRKDLSINYPIFDMTATQGNYAAIEYLGAASGWQNTIPYMLFFDAAGRYRGHHYGMVDQEGLEKTVEKLYAAKP